MTNAALHTSEMTPSERIEADPVSRRVQDADGGTDEPEGDADSGGDERPLRWYAAIMGGYGVVTAVLLALTRRRRAKAPALSVTDLALYGIATHKASRLVAKDLVTRPLRAPFTEVTGSGAPGEINERPRGSGARFVVGELLSCPFCLGQWFATAAVFGHLFAPRLTRTVAGIFVVHTISDVLQFGYTAVEKATDG